MIYGLLADLVLALHAFFVVFVVLGGLVALRWRRAVFVHIPCALWSMGRAGGLDLPADTTRGLVAAASR